eukprot:m51a1_g8528 putative protein kinase domain containing protein (952) ;mRNA; f:128198-131667
MPQHHPRPLPLPLPALGGPGPLRQGALRGLLLLGLLGLLAGTAGGRCYASGGLSVDKYDADVSDAWPLAPVAAPLTPGSCSPPGVGSAVEVVQLLTPARVPWAISEVCVLLGGALSSSESVEVALYPEVDGAPGPDSSATVVGATAWVSPSVAWVNVPAGGLVARSPRVYVGFRVASACNALVYNTQAGHPAAAGRRSFWRQGPSHPWSLRLADWAHDNVSVVSIRTLGGPSSLPPDWSCPARLYNDSVCHCGCGAPDLDCSKTALSPNCTAPGAVCSPLATCVVPGWDAARCPLASYGIGDGCQCGCGGALVDPDCRASTVAGAWYPRADNCPGVARCSDAGACVDAWPSCSAGLYGDGTCHCGCGASGGVLDPDCLATNHSDCASGQTCVAGACRAFPPAWRCSPSMYGQYPDLTHRLPGVGCDCFCGVFDPDCRYQDSQNLYANGCDTDMPICSKTLECDFQSPAGDGIVDAHKEECDSGKGCVGNKCGLGYQPKSPVWFDCDEVCGNSMVNGTEECDSGAFCTPQCRCLAGHSAIGKPFCSGCGNGFLEAGEQCDSGAGCDSSCQCVRGFEPSGNQSTYCVQSKSFCGDSTVDAGEDCDGGYFCHWQNCTCYPGHSPYAQRGKSCRGCGNGVAEDTEQCDGTEGCDPATCKCVQGYTRSDSVYGCQLVSVLCGNLKIDDGEQCDGGPFCELDCKCSEGHAAESPARTFCAGCGNGYVDAGEQCDGGYGCANCSCASDFTVMNPPTVACTWIVPIPPEKNKTVVVVTVSKKDNRVVGAAVGASAGIAVAVCAVLGAVVAVVRSIRKKEEPSRPLDVPGSNVSFVTTTPAEGVNPMGPQHTMFNSAVASSELAQGTPYVHSRTADGTPIIVVPCSSSDSSGTPVLPRYPGMEVVQGGVSSAGPVDPLVTMSLAAQMPQIVAAVHNVPVEMGDGPAVVAAPVSSAGPVQP